MGAKVTSFLRPALPSSSASEELTGSSALDQPSLSSGASGGLDVLLQPREDQAPVRTPSRSRAAYARPRHPHVSAGGACPSRRCVKAGRTPAGFRFNCASCPGGLGHSTCFLSRKRTPASTRAEANEGKAFLINTCNSQHPSAGRENSSSRCWVLGAPRPGRGPPCAGHGQGRSFLRVL